jgi:acyl-coenzyme A thioesterase PaaI-like protein
MKNKSLQEIYAPNGICFGCGCKNKRGLQVKSYVKDSLIVSSWRAKKYHEAFPGVLNGGVIGSILDCHCNWAAAYFLMKDQGLNITPCTVTADYSIKLKKPTPSDAVLALSAYLIKIQNNVVTIESTLVANEKICAVCIGTFVAVGSNHPAYHRW